MRAPLSPALVTLAAIVMAAACSSSDNATPQPASDAPDAGIGSDEGGVAEGGDVDAGEPSTETVVLNPCASVVRTCTTGMPVSTCPPDKLAEQVTVSKTTCGCSADRPQGAPCPSGCTPTGAETCNGVDDDCDGAVDNVPGTTDAIIDACGSFDPKLIGVGLCHLGARACAAGAYSACGDEQGPTSETCNGYDDDCDGYVDNQIAGTPPDGPNGKPLVVACGAQGMLSPWGSSGTQDCIQGATVVNGDPLSCALDTDGGRVVRAAAKVQFRFDSAPTTTFVDHDDGVYWMVPFDGAGLPIDEAYLQARFVSKQPDELGYTTMP